jgi:uncharacterized protein with FMN-binding domain
MEQKKSMVFPGVLLILFSMPLFAGGQKEKAMPGPVDFSRLRDGVYQGEAKNWPVAVNVDVEIVSQKIVSIVITRHREGRGESAAAIVDRIIAAQSLGLAPE